MLGFSSINFYPFIANILLFFIWSKAGLKDNPNQRSNHKVSTSTSGGIFFLLPLIINVIWMGCENGELLKSCNGFIFGAVVLTVVGFIDDCKDVSYKIRLFTHVFAVSVLLYFFEFNLPLNILLILLGVGLINACNFLDGINGFLSTQWLLTIGFLLVSFFSFNNPIWQLWGCVLAFLLFNFPKAKVFMGDSGSTVLGYSYFYVILQVLHSFSGSFPYIFAKGDLLILFCLFPMAFAWMDVAGTMISRIVRKSSILLSYKDYGFHNLSAFFNSHVVPTVAYLSANLLLCAFAYLAMSDGNLMKYLCVLYFAVQVIVSYILFFRLR